MYKLENSRKHEHVLDLFFYYHVLEVNFSCGHSSHFEDDNGFRLKVEYKPLCLHFFLQNPGQKYSLLIACIDLPKYQKGVIHIGQCVPENCYTVIKRYLKINWVQFSDELSQCSKSHPFVTPHG